MVPQALITGPTEGTLFFPSICPKSVLVEYKRPSGPSLKVVNIRCYVRRRGRSSGTLQGNVE